MVVIPDVGLLGLASVFPSAPQHFASIVEDIVELSCIVLGATKVPNISEAAGRHQNSNK